MEISDQLRCLFTATIEEQNGAYRIEVPNNELEVGSVREGETYRVAVFSSPASDGTEASGVASDPAGDAQESPEPPVAKGDTRTVGIEDVGDQGDGIARVERGFVVIVPDTEQGERVEIEITDVSDTVAFGTVTERLNHA